MKSFLREIEDKFVELEEVVNVSKDDLSNPQIQQLIDDPEKEVNVEGKDDHNCKRDHPGMTHEEFELKEIDEMSVTGGLDGGAGPPKMKHAFSPADEDTITQGGYSKVHEAMDRKYERLIESYRQFSRGDKKMTPENKVKRTIQEVSKKLKEIEILVNHTNKLKTESGMSRDNYGPRTEKALNKISEKLIKIAERVRAIGE